VTVVTPEQLQETPAQSLDDILRTVPSVNVPQTASYQVHPTANSVSMRGLGGIRALVMIDGVPINDPFFGYVQWNRIPMESIERVEVLRGAGSPLWGNYAMGGVINIITRVPDKQEFGLEGGYGSYTTYRANGYGALVPSEKFSLGANFNYWGTNGFNQVPPELRTPLEVPTSFVALNGQLTSNFRLDSTLRGYVRAAYHQNDQTLITPLQTNSQWIMDIAAGATKSLGGSDLTATAFYEHSNFLTNNTETPFGDPPFTAEFLSNRHRTLVNSGGGSLLWSTRLNDTFRLLSVGGDARVIAGSDTADIFDEAGTQTRTDIGRGKQLFLATFGQASVFPVTSLEFLGSARLQYFLNFDGFDNAPGAPGDVPSKSYASFDPKLSARYQLAPPVAVRAAGYTAFRAPNLDNLYRSFTVTGAVFQPNPFLKPEKLWGFEAGPELTWGPVRAQLTGYYAKINDLITFRNLTPAELPPGFFFGTQNINAGAAQITGVEAIVDWRIGYGLSANVGWSYASSRIVENEFEPASVGNQQAGIPPQQVSASLTYSHPIGVRAFARMRWVSESFGDNLQTLPIPSHVVVDASLAYRFLKHFEVFVDFQNLLDNSYIADNSGFNPPLLGTPFTAFGGFRAKY
jgi:outer membrane receptor protein involved in Fe transport